MSKGNEQLEVLLAQLERGGDDERLDIVRRAQRFKRSWVELAEGLAKLKRSRAYERWGYADLHEYCQKELHLKPSTIDKLVMSYGTLRSHAPEVLDHDGFSREIPSLDSVDYFSRKLGVRSNDDGDDAAPARRRLDAPKAVLEELRSAVFDEARPVGELRKRFDPIFKPKREVDPEQDVIKKTRALAQKLAEAVPAVPGLSDARAARVIAMVEALVRDLDELIDDDESQDADERKAG